MFSMVPCSRRGASGSAWYYPRHGEDLHAAVNREVLAVRNSVGTLDASTLGKIDIQGPDSVTFLNWLYSNAWSSSGGQAAATASCWTRTAWCSTTA